jgi:hypothetical protein
MLASPALRPFAHTGFRTVSGVICAFGLRRNARDTEEPRALVTSRCRLAKIVDDEELEPAEASSCVGGSVNAAGVDAQPDDCGN